MSDPTDPFSSLGEAAAQLHELFLSFVKAGFTEAQAIALVAGIITGNKR